MSQEAPKEFPSEEIKKMIQRVDDLKETDSPEEDSRYNLAKNEDAIRDDLREGGTREDKIDGLANEYSTKDLERIEAEKREIKAKEEALIDELTGVGNVRLLRREIPGRLMREIRAGEESFFMMIDADEFKEINDTCGHPTGDLVLKILADVLKESVRGSDAIFRIGGDEFAIYFPNTKDINNVYDIANRIIDKYKKKIQEIEEINKAGIKSSLSIGFSHTSQITNKISDPKKADMKIMNDILEELKNKADAALYESKRLGRGVATLFEEGMRMEMDKK